MTGSLPALVAASTLFTATSASAEGPYAGHGAASVSRETIAKYAPPPLAPGVSARIQMRLDVRSPGLGQLPPDGQRLLFLEQHLIGRRRDYGSDFGPGSAAGGSGSECG